MRLRILVVAVLGMLLVPAASGAAGSAGTVPLAQCGANPLVECGFIQVPLYWSHPGVGEPLEVSFRVCRHTDRAAPAGESVVAFEGGPGYPSIGSAGTYLFMLRILRGLGVQRVDVYGDSYGSYAVQAFTANHPNLVRAVVLDGTYDNSFDPSGRITVSFPTNRPDGQATVPGTLGGRRVRARLAAPWTTQG